MLKIYKIHDQAYGEFNGGEIIENKPLGFPGEGDLKGISNLFYWAHAKAKVTSTIPLHPHKGFEILTFVINGKIDHFDTSLNKWLSLEKGDVQIIKSGSGIAHSEKLYKDSEIFQIWFDPNLDITLREQPKYMDFKESKFTMEDNEEIKTILYTGEDSPLKLDSEGIEIYKIDYQTGTYKLKNEFNKFMCLYLMEGSSNINGSNIEQNDFILSDEKILNLEFETPSSVFIIETPKQLTYRTYIEKYGR